MNPYKSIYIYTCGNQPYISKVSKKKAVVFYIHCQPRWDFNTSIIQVVGVGSFYGFHNGSIRVKKTHWEVPHIMFPFCRGWF